MGVMGSQVDFYPRMRKDRDNIARKFRLCKKNGQVHESASRVVNTLEIGGKPNRESLSLVFA
jgi:hypothetical protein